MSDTGQGHGVRVAGVDLGATSGRVIVAEVSGDRLELEEVHRFPNGAVRVRGSLHWDVLGIFAEVLVGLRRAARGGALDGIGIDSWAVDYGLLDSTGDLLGNPYSHRDPRVEGVAGQVADKVGAQRLYEVTGLQQLPFNTIYQLVAERDSPRLGAASTLLLLPDLLGFWLTGSVGAERTNASTTGLYDARGRAWARGVADELGVPTEILPPLRDPGDLVGTLLPEVAEALDAPASTPVIAVGSHDTASAVVAVPASGAVPAYVSSGTWSLVGLELDAPVLSEAARAADFTNEGGVDGTVRFLRNLTGLWVLDESVRGWSVEDGAAGETGIDLAAVLEAAGAVEPLRSVVDVNDHRLLAPATGGPGGSMPDRIATLALETGQPVPRGRAETVRCILDSLALGYRRQLRTAAALAGVRPDVLHVVGGGSRNELLCRLAAEACDLPVLAGPVEASALGNVLVQARALGVDLPDLAAMRSLVARTQDLRRHDASAEHTVRAAWDAAEARLAGA